MECFLFPLKQPLLLTEAELIEMYSALSKAERYN